MPSKSRLTKNIKDSDLLEQRICDLPLKLKGNQIDRCIRQLFDELDEKGFRFKPYFWISDEFFTPVGIPGIAIPFYLTHPRLIQLERKQMFEAEGSGFNECMKILRHELGHAIEHAYHLTRRKKRQLLFGKTTQKYPQSYSPKPYSRSYVTHLDNWYAQAHPDEDFAETFAVWFRPGSRWRKKYQGWPALKKLIYVDELMNEIKDQSPLVKTKRKELPYTQIKQTLSEYYEEKKERFGLNTKEDFYDRELLKLFTKEKKDRSQLSAARFIRKIRKEARRTVAFGTGQYRYAIDEIIEEVIERCEELELYTFEETSVTQLKFTVFLTVQTMNTLHSGGYGLAL